MSIETEFQSTIQNVQNAYNGLNNLGATIPQNKTIENISSCLDEIYDNLPKTEYQEGTEVNLGVTSKGKLDFENGIVGIGQTEQDGTPTPSTPITINSVTGNQNVVVSGKNILDESTLSQGAWNGTTTKRVYFYANNYLNAGTYTIMTDLNTTDFRYAVNIASNQFPLGSGMSINVYDSNWITTSYKTFTLSQGGYLGVGVKRANEGDIVPSDISSYHFMIYEGEYDSSISYEPYITPTSYQLSLGDIELNAIGNYKDELIYDVDEDRVYKNEKIKEITLNGTEDWNAVSSAMPNTSRFFFNSEDVYNPGTAWTSEKDVFSNMFKPMTWNEIYGDDTTTANGISNYSSTDAQMGRIVIRISNDIATSSTFITWLENNQPKAYYVKAQATEIPIADTTLINQVKALYNAHSNNGTTIITSNGNLPMIIKCRGLKGE